MRFASALALVAVGGAAGTAARVTVSFVFPDQALASTLAVNVVGAFLLGVLLEGLTDRGRRRGLRLLAGTGFCGGFTTYSLVALQVAVLTRGGDAGSAAAYAVATLVLGGLATLAGILLAAVVRPPGEATGEGLHT